VAAVPTISAAVASAAKLVRRMWSSLGHGCELQKTSLSRGRPSRNEQDAEG
jgi:hypothetical protein